MVYRTVYALVAAPAGSTSAVGKMSGRASLFERGGSGRHVAAGFVLFSSDSGLFPVGQFSGGSASDVAALCGCRIPVCAPYDGTGSLRMAFARPDGDDGGGVCVCWLPGRGRN